MASELWNRTMAELQAGRLAGALSSLRTHQRMKPRDPEVAQLLGMVLMRAGEVAQAAVQMQRATELDPSNAVHHNNLGTVLLTAKRYREASEAYARAVGLAPQMAGAWMGLANAHLALEHTDLALQASSRAIAMAPHESQIVTCHVEGLTRAGRQAEAHALLQAHVRDRPDDTDAQSVLLFAMNYGLDDPGEVVAAHREFGARLPRPDPPTLPFVGVRPLRIGVVSCDLRGHSVGFFAESFMRERPADAEIVVFSTATPAWSDAITKRLQGFAKAWHQVERMDDAGLDALIRRERIDVLLELAGHFIGNRLPALARKPAPVIVTAIGYPNTTGVPAIDLRLVDSITDPPGAEDLCTERLLRLDPCFLCYTPPQQAPEPAMPPADAPITFGSFNNANKISQATAELWGGLMRAVPHARLLLKARRF
ncbi:MAG: tetratricopeptide repeat protein, partial [Planctomycetota bacterium]